MTALPNIQTAPAAPKSAIRTRSVATKHYPALKTIIFLFYGCAILIGLAELANIGLTIAGLVASTGAIADSDAVMLGGLLWFPGLAWIGVTFVAAAFAILINVAIAECIKLAIDIQDNTEISARSVR